MKGKRHGLDQIISKLRDADAMLATGASIGQVCQRLEVSEPTFHRWRNQYGGMKSHQAKHFKIIEHDRFLDVHQCIFSRCPWAVATGNRSKGKHVGPRFVGYAIGR